LKLKFGILGLGTNGSEFHEDRPVPLLSSRGGRVARGARHGGGAAGRRYRREVTIAARHVAFALEHH
jgi:hypothetical protein